MHALLPQACQFVHLHNAAIGRHTGRKLNDGTRTRMATSADYRRIKRQVCEIIAQVPAGKLTTTSDIGAALGVPARHVAHIVGTLDLMDRIFLPWHRVLDEQGRVLAGSHRAEQVTRLRKENVVLDECGTVRGLASASISIGQNWFTGPIAAA
jgi:alkylated DNA nucleotide flippase Atl1